MKSSVRISRGIFLILIASLIGGNAEDRLRIIRRITASDLPPTLNQNNTFDGGIYTTPSSAEEDLVTNVSINTTNISQVDDVTNPPIQLNLSEILETSATTSRRHRFTTEAPKVVSTTSPSNTSNTSSTVASTRRPYIRSNRTNIIRSRNLNCTSGLIGSNCEQRVAANEIKPVVELNNSTTVKPTVAANEIKPVVGLNNSTTAKQSVAANEIKPVVELNNSTTAKQTVAANETKPVVKLNNDDNNSTTTNDEKQDNDKKKTPKEKLQESSTTDKTFNSIVSSSTARIVIQENIHTDILRHLTTPSYAHYETDYVMDDDPYEAESHASANKASTTNSYEEYAKQGKEINYNISFSTPSTKLFDEAYARVSEGIRQNLDDIEEKSDEYEHYSSSSDNEEAALAEGLPKNDSKVSLQYLNHVNVVSNDSADANSRHGDLFIGNGTHVQLETSYVQTKITPEVSSTIRYLYDDEYSTTRRITTADEEEDNNIKESVASSSDQIDQDGAENGGTRSQIEGRDNIKEGYTTTTYREINDRDVVTPPSETNIRSRKNITPGKQNVQLSDTPFRVVLETSSPIGTTIRTNTNGRSRMYSSERYPIYNTNNTVEEGVTDKLETKRTRNWLSYQNTTSTEPTDGTRSKLYSSRTSVTTPSSRRFVSSNVETTLTPPRGNIIRTRRPILNTTARPSSNADNNEGNDISINENYRLPNKRGTVKYGNLRSTEQSEMFPIPPTASAWSLVTMKEPGRRTRLSSVQTTTPPSDQSDSEASGSFSKGTTIFNVLAPSSYPNSTSPNKYITSNAVENKVPITTESSVFSYFNESDGNNATEYPNTDILTTHSSVADTDDYVTTQRPYETTTMSNHDMDEGILDEEDVRFDGTSRTTTVPSTDVDLESTTINSDSVQTTTDSYETTRMPRESGDKTAEDEEDVESVNTTPEPVVADVEPGMHEEIQGALGNSQGEINLEGNQENKNLEQGSKTNEEKEKVPEVEQGVKDNETGVRDNETGVKDNETGVKDNVGPKPHDEVSQKEEGNGRTNAEGNQQEDGQSAVEEESDYGGPSGSETETDMPSVIGGMHGKKAVVEEETTTDATITTNKPIETSTMSTTEVPLTTVESSTKVPEISDIHTFIRLFVETTIKEFCDLIAPFKKAVADRLAEGTSRPVTEKQVILRNIGNVQCSNQDTANTTTEGELIPVEMHIVDENGHFDQQLNDAFPLLWGHLDLDFSLRIRKVDVVDESLAYSGSKASGAVIAAITISCIAGVCLLILAALLIVMRKRQKKVNYGMRCTPVSLDAYSLDSVSVHGSVRRKGGVRASKRSYGNPAFDDPGSPTHPMNFANLATFVTDRDAIEEEFSNIPHVTPKSDELPEGAETKNRYANVIPLPETRVVLTVQGEEPLSDYINANYVTGTKNATKVYIACQGPLQSTVTDFWRMIWEKQSKVVIMLTDLVENGVEKCADYLPPSEVLDCHRLFGDYQVTLKKREVRETYVISTLQLKNMESNSWREIVHLWYLEWPSQGVPEEPSSIIAFLIEARSYMKNSNGPSVVHCSPGTGRTGTILACDLCIRDFEQTRLVDVPRCVARLRKDRAGCVQTRDQYMFIYQVLHLYATKLTGGALDEAI